MTHMPLRTRGMRGWLVQFHKDTYGAVTVDWIVLTSAIVGLGVAVMIGVGAGAKEISGDIRTCITIAGNRMITQHDGTMDDYTRELGVAARNCNRLQ